VPWAGARGNAIVTGSPPVELVASGLALAQRTGRSAADVVGDPAFAEEVGRAADALGLELARLVNALDPGAVVIGGGLGLNDAYRERAVRTMRAGVYAESTRALPVRPAALGPDAGVVGAALAAPLAAALR